MAFDTIETSEFFEPIELYEFKRGVFSWFFTSADANVSFAGKTYLAQPISRGQIVSTQDIGKTTLKIKVSRRNIFAIQFIEASPTDIITLTITRIHASDQDPAVTFKGRVINVGFSENSATITCQPNQSSLRRPGLRRLYQTSCPHVLYGGPCGVLRLDFEVSATLTGVSGLVLTAPEFIHLGDGVFNADWFLGGFVEINNGGIISTRFITDHDNSGGTITLNLTLSNAVVGSIVTVLPGCDHAPATCNNKFSNIESYGGFPFIPQKNPQNGTSIF
ncbi:MAG: DUF2163 domain-containing protein [Desulfocapsa sp.]|nr:DUF2163 domain-containing protein [Desulfocapsa sp.]